MKNSDKYEHDRSVYFTGKEKDAETGYSYFGARYYDSDLSGLFLSVDPMADKYPNISPYAYCAWNPLKLVDPDGRKWKSEKDNNKADEIKECVQKRINYLTEQINTTTGMLSKENLGKKETDNLNYELSELINQVSLLNDFISGLAELESSDVYYTFNPTRSNINKVKTFARPGTLFYIKYQSANEANLVHEITHAIQVDRMEHFRMEKIGELEMEIGAYSVQYSFSPNSLPASDSSIMPSSRLSGEWVKRIFFFDNGKKYPYEEYK